MREATREEIDAVLREFEEPVAWVARQRMAREIATLRARLAECERDRDAARWWARAWKAAATLGDTAFWTARAEAEAMRGVVSAARAWADFDAEMCARFEATKGRAGMTALRAESVEGLNKRMDAIVQAVRALDHAAGGGEG